MKHGVYMLFYYRYVYPRGLLSSRTNTDVEACDEACVFGLCRWLAIPHVTRVHPPVIEFTDCCT